MNKYGYEGNETFRPLSPWAYFGYSLLFCVPVIGQIFLIVYSVSDANINRRNYARSYFCWLVIALIMIAIAALGGFNQYSFRYLFR